MLSCLVLPLGLLWNIGMDFRRTPVKRLVTFLGVQALATSHAVVWEWGRNIVLIMQCKKEECAGLRLGETLLRLALIFSPVV